uniref:Histone deacetylase 11 n=1 Tax=Gopherus evgoodei TaxID=1825980 RepID=A0A8C4W1L1_9SAUR
MPHRTELYHEVPPTCWPIVYSPDYNITFMGLEKLHPFDAGKWGKVINFLKGNIMTRLHLLFNFCLSGVKLTLVQRKWNRSNCMQAL